MHALVIIVIANASANVVVIMPYRSSSQTYALIIAITIGGCGIPTVGLTKTQCFVPDTETITILVQIKGHTALGIFLVNKTITIFVAGATGLRRGRQGIAWAQARLFTDTDTDA